MGCETWKAEALSIQDDTERMFGWVIKEWQPADPSHCICQIKRGNLNLLKSTHWQSQSRLTGQRSPLCNISGETGRNKKRAERTDISGNRLDNRHKHWEPAPCTGTHWLVGGAKSPAQESFPEAAPLPLLTWAPCSPLCHAAAGIWLEHCRQGLGFPCGHHAVHRNQEEAGAQECSSVVAQTLVKTWMRKGVRVRPGLFLLFANVYA